MWTNSAGNTVCKTIDLLCGCVRKAFNCERLFCFAVLLFIATSRISAAGAEESTCALAKPGEQVAVKYVIDGDTVILDNGRRVRLIGINTPEIGRDGQQSEPYARKARNVLIKMLPTDFRVSLQGGRQYQDKYKRRLGHLFLADGTNLQASILRKGLATSLIIPPNTRYQDCYFEAEANARKERLGIWSLPEFQPQTASILNRNARGYRVVRGKVSRIGKSASSIWINLGDRFALRITRDDLTRFKGIDFDGFVGLKVVVRGWLYSQKEQLRMRIRHPAYIEIEDDADW